MAKLRGTRDVLGIFAVGASFFLLASLLSYDVYDDPSRAFPVREQVHNLGGETGFQIARALFAAFGVIGGYAAAGLALLLSLSILGKREPTRDLPAAVIGGAAAVLALAAVEAFLSTRGLFDEPVIGQDLGGRLAGGYWGVFLVHWVSKSFAPSAVLLVAGVGLTTGLALASEFVRGGWSARALAAPPAPPSEDGSDLAAAATRPEQRTKGAAQAEEDPAPEETDEEDRSIKSKGRALSERVVDFVIDLGVPLGLKLRSPAEAREEADDDTASETGDEAEDSAVSSAAERPSSLVKASPPPPLLSPELKAWAGERSRRAAAGARSLASGARALAGRWAEAWKERQQARQPQDALSLTAEVRDRGASEEEAKKSEAPMPAEAEAALARVRGSRPARRQDERRDEGHSGRSISEASRARVTRIARAASAQITRRVAARAGSATPEASGDLTEALFSEQELEDMLVSVFEEENGQTDTGLADLAIILAEDEQAPEAPEDDEDDQADGDNQAADDDSAVIERTARAILGARGESEAEEDEDEADEDEDEEDEADEDEDEDEEDEAEDEDEEAELAALEAAMAAPYAPPPLDLLEERDDTDDADIQAQVEEKARLIEECLGEFRIEAKVENIERGPNVTLYALSIGKGIKVQRVAALLDNLALVLASPGAIRLQAPIPGTSWVGLEVPNARQEMVTFREIYEQPGWREQDLALPLFLGKDTSGRPVVGDLARLPHLLVAGATGSGKSVCINTMILSLLMTRSPKDVKLILIDPKQVELAPFSEVPHLLAPVVTDMQHAGSVLDWAVQKMEDRYSFLAKARVRHLKEYNKLGKTELAKRMGLKSEAELEKKGIPWKLPYIVVVVDELNDLMMIAQKEVEASIMRLAQKSRAIGIHVILATQRPSVDVITGVIKSNLPARMAFQVTSKVDSRTILDTMGAEKLLGMGDMLFLPPGKAQPIRAKGVYVSQDEMDRVLATICARRKPIFNQDLLDLKDAPPPEKTKKGRGKKSKKKASEEVDDGMLDEAMALVIENQRGSVSLLQRKLGIGYARASRLIEALEEQGVLGAHKGSKARKVLVSKDDWAGRS